MKYVLLRKLLNKKINRASLAFVIYCMLTTAFEPELPELVIVPRDLVLGISRCVLLDQAT